MSNTNDDNVIKISKMLEIGGTMLAQQCDNCGAPLFRYQGRVLCPVCEDIRDPRRAMQSPPTADTSSSPITGPSSIKEKETPVAAISDQSSCSDMQEKKPVKAVAPVQLSVPELESLMIKKMISLASEMQDEKDVRKIIDYLDMIDRCMDTVAKMRGLL
ncbi:Sjogren's syndrome/scleroderma autoantigen 1 family protein [Methanolobus sp. ZRKC5]|uniref:Sjogren's syndrome/scleroderma autoantigen 1 family protein n=1 Tax=unclassified Methanolobus TaxID=2629569 RepID=UPI00313C7251